MKYEKKEGEERKSYIRTILTSDQGIHTNVEGAVEGGNRRSLLERGEGGVSGVEGKQA